MYVASIAGKIHNPFQLARQLCCYIHNYDKLIIILLLKGQCETENVHEGAKINFIHVTLSKQYQFSSFIR